MKNTGWVFLVLVMLICQVLTLVMLADKKTREDKEAEIREATLRMENEAAMHHLESEKLRRTYYEALVNAGLLSREFLDGGSGK